MSRLRVAAVPYLNLKPFLAALQTVRKCRILLRQPSALPQVFRSEDLDLCLLSAADLFALGFRPLAGACISSHGPVESVALFSSSHPSIWRRVALDAASSTSNQLARLLLGSGPEAAPAFQVVADPAAVLEEGRCDAALLIGDRALCPFSAREWIRVDLGEAWRLLTGLPFVYAAWTPGRGNRLDPAELEEILAEAAAASPHFVEPCAAAHAAATGLPARRLERYLRESISYRFSTAERQGLEVFGSLLGQHRSLRAAGMAPLEEPVFHAWPEGSRS